jgi:hypothetical protein
MNYNCLIKSKTLAWNCQFHKISSSRWIFISEFYICVCDCVGNGGFILKIDYDVKCFVECINWQFTFDWIIVMNKTCTFKSITDIFMRMNFKLSLFHYLNWNMITIQCVKSYILAKQGTTRLTNVSIAGHITFGITNWIIWLYFSGIIFTIAITIHLFRDYLITLWNINI